MRELWVRYLLRFVWLGSVTSCEVGLVAFGLWGLGALAQVEIGWVRFGGLPERCCVNSGMASVERKQGCSSPILLHCVCCRL